MELSDVLWGQKFLFSIIIKMIFKNNFLKKNQLEFYRSKTSLNYDPTIWSVYDKSCEIWIFIWTFEHLFLWFFTDTNEHEIDVLSTFTIVTETLDDETIFSRSSPWISEPMVKAIIDKWAEENPWDYKMLFRLVW